LNPHSSHPYNPISMIKILWQYRQLIRQMIWREVAGRYKGSFFGLFWSFINPVLLLTVYTFVFSVVFKARWGIGENESKTVFALILFVGLIMHGLLAEVLTSAPGLILRNINYVKKVVFPLEILPVVNLGAAVFHSSVSIIVFLIAFVILNGHLQVTILFIPVILFALSLLALGLGWFLASLGVYIRDIGQTVGILVTILLFTSPVFFPVSTLPEQYQPFMMINPLTFIITESRKVLVWGQTPDWAGLCLYFAVSTIIAWAGFAWFQKTRKGFADVV